MSLREKIRSHSYRDLGITQPTDSDSGNYDSGTIDIFRGTRCAGEEFVKNLADGPCGPGTHSAAYYQWGLDRNPDKDAAELVTNQDGSAKLVFSSSDGWQLPPDLKRKVDIEAKIAKAAETQFADDLEREVRSRGYHMTIFAAYDTDELVIDSAMFEQDEGRVSFLCNVLPAWKRGQSVKWAFIPCG